ncbi:methyltransferase domain-containing protein [Candidatus Micrarchaeota archaeon]|nr:methyltransferase domain-containing protein [Candidatus Micrarchaeota archaeon]
MEEDYVLPELYFSKATALAYERNGRMRKIQKEMTERAVELLELKRGRVLDVGCGTGFSLSVLKDSGFDATGIDISEAMLEIARAKGFNVKQADFRSLPFTNSYFEGIVSVSALQWVHGKSYQDIVDYYRDIASEFKRVLKKNGRAVIQFYPKIEGEFGLCVRAFVSVGFNVVIAEDYPNIPKKRKRYIILQK